MSAGGADSQGWGAVPLRVRILLAGAVALAISALFWRAGGRPPAPEEEPRAPMPTRLQPDSAGPEDVDREAPPITDGYRREIVRPKPVQNLAEGAASTESSSAAQPPGGPASRRRDEKKTLPEIFRMPSDPGRTGGEPPEAPPAEPREKAVETPLADAFAPFGRLVKCQLIDTLDSVTARSEPIVALVTQDLDWNGNVIIPAGTEAFSYAKPEALIDAMGVGRLVDSGEWTLVLPAAEGRANGSELILKARAVDRREILVNDRGGVRSWGLDDGADGLVGYTLSTLDNKEIKLFAAAAVSGLAQGFGAIGERQQPASGIPGAFGATQIAPTLGNALVGSASAGAVEVMNAFASRIREEISKRGVYVRVPAGKAFYLFVEQTIDPRSAAVGLRQAAQRGLAR